MLVKTLAVMLVNIHKLRMHILLFVEVTCAIDVNNSLTDWFDVENGIKQDYIISNPVCHVH